MTYSLTNLILTRSQSAGYRMNIRHLRIASGEKIAITGKSGCGKSTALDMLGLVLQPDSAEEFSFACGENCVDIAAAWRHSRIEYLAELRRLHLGYILQTGGLLPFLSVEENMSLGAHLRERDTGETRALVGKLAETLGISTLLSSLPGLLSVGERQRVAIGRALASRPDVVLADEPTAALDPYNAQTVMHMLMDAVALQNTTLVIVTHDLRFVSEFTLREVPIQLESDDGVTTAIIDDRKIS